MSQVVALPPIGLLEASLEATSAAAPSNADDDSAGSDSAWAVESDRQQQLGELSRRSPEFLGVHHLVQGEAAHTVGGLQLLVEPCPASGLGQAVLRILPAAAAATGDEHPVIVPLAIAPAHSNSGDGPSDASRLRYAFGHRLRVVRVSQRLVSRSFPIAAGVNPSGPSSPPSEPGEPRAAIPMAPPQLQEPVVEIDIAVDRPAGHSRYEGAVVARMPHVRVGESQCVWLSTMGGRASSSLVLGTGTADELDIQLHTASVVATI